MGQARQTFERRQLGLTLRRLRDRAGKFQQDAADAIGKVRSRIAQLENGTGTVTAGDLEKLLNLYGVQGGERNTVLALGAEARKRTKRATYTDVLPDSFQRHADLEADAREINYYDVGVIPGILQSPDYVTETIKGGDGIWWERSPNERASREIFRLERQERILNADRPKKLNFIFTEDALYSQASNADVIRGQLEHLLHIADKHPNVTIQILTLGTAHNPAPNGGLILLEFGDSAARVGVASVAYGPSTYFYDDADTAALHRAFTRIRELALSPEESLQLIRKKLEVN